MALKSGIDWKFKRRPIKISGQDDISPDGLEKVFSHYDKILTHLFERTDNIKDLTVDGDITCESIYVDGDSIYIGGVKLSKPTDAQDGYYLKYDKGNAVIDLDSTSTPASHSSSHENGGADEISIAGLSGEPEVTDELKRYSLLVG